MPTTTIRSGSSVATHPVTASFTDVTTSITGAANVAGFLRNLTAFPLVVVKGGSGAPDATSQGEVLLAYDAVYCEASNIWVRSANGSNATVIFETL